MTYENYIYFWYRYVELRYDPKIKPKTADCVGFTASSSGINAKQCFSISVFCLQNVICHS